MTTYKSSDYFSPLTIEQLSQLKKITDNCSLTQLSWLSGYFWGLVNNTQYSVTVESSHKENNRDENENNNTNQELITLISCSQTGNARNLAKQLQDILLSEKIKVNLVNAQTYNFKQIYREKILIFITSTYGEGEPPDEAIALYKFLMSNKIPRLKETAFAVFGLGDSSYEFFNQAAKNIDYRLEELGAKRLLQRIDADTQHDKQFDVWQKQLIKILKERCSKIVKKHSTTFGIVNKQTNSDNCIYTKDVPLVTEIISNQRITGRNSNKDIRHIEIDLGDSGLRYQPGDSLGVWYENNESLVNELIDIFCLKHDEIINFKGKNLPLFEVLKIHCELTVNRPQIIEQYAILSSNKILLSMLNDKQKLQHYAQSYPIVDMFRERPYTTIQAEQLISLLSPLTPRLYSISSAQAETPMEVHITVNVVRYKIQGHTRGGGASTWLADHAKEGNKIKIFIESNENFRLPIQKNVPIIMFAAGTGIAPFRAFMQQRSKDRSPGKNWLFFGNQYFTEDFLYQVEWQKYFKDGLLNNIDLAWSRDQAQKIYIQDKIRAKGSEVWNWIKNSAHLYVCGNANNMAKEVHQALVEVISQYGKMNYQNTKEFLMELRMSHRYQRDIY